MVNFGLNSASILGIFLAVAGASLYFLRSVRPELARDHDIFFAAVGLLCGFILLFQGWRLDPILQFGQFLLTGTTIFFAVESIRLRKVATEQARRNTPTVDRDRPVSRTRVYREEEYNDRDRSIPEAYSNVYEGAEANYDSPRLRGYEDPQPRSPRSRNSREPNGRDRRPRNRPDGGRVDSSRADRYEATEAPARPVRPRNRPPRQDNRSKGKDGGFGDQWQEKDGWDSPSPQEPSYPDNSDRRMNRSNDRPSPSDRSRPFEDQSRQPRRRPDSNPPVRPQGFKDEELGKPYNTGLGSSYSEDMGDSYQDDDNNYSEAGDNYDGRGNSSNDYVDYQPISNLGSSYDDNDDQDYDDQDYDSQDYQENNNPELKPPISDWDG